MNKLALLCLFLSFHFCYLEWGGDNAAFLFQMEYQILFQQNNVADSMMHPAVLIPFVGLLLVLLALFQKQPDNRIVWAALLCMGLFVLLVLLIGILSGSPRIALSTMPFLLSAIWCIRLLTLRKSDTVPKG